MMAAYNAQQAFITAGSKLLPQEKLNCFIRQLS